MANKYPEVETVRIVDSTGVIIESFGGSGGVSQDDDTAFTPGSSAGTPALGLYESSPSAVTDGHAAAIAIDANRNVKVSIEADNAGIGGGTQYTEDAAAAANPVGTALIMVRDDALSGQTSADGDNVAARGTDKGELYVKHTDTLTVDGSGVTQPVSAASLPLPTGAATAAKQPALGTAGSASADVITVQGIASMTALKVDGSAVAQPVTDNEGTLSVDDGAGSLTVDGTVTVQDGGGSITVDNGGTFAVQASVAAGATNIAKAEDAASADADVGVPAMAVRKATPANTSGSDGDYEMLQMSAGRLWASATIDAALPAGTNAIGKLAANSGVDIGDVDVTSVVPGTGATNLGKAEDAAHTSGDIGVMALAVRKDTATQLAGTDADYSPLITDANGRLHTVAALVPVTAGGLSMFKSIDLDETEEEIKSSAGQLYGFYAYNNAASGTKRYLKFYNNTAAGVTVGTTVPDLTFELDGGQGMVISFPQGIAMSTGITAAATTGVADNDSGAPSANDVLLNAWYK